MDFHEYKNSFDEISERLVRNGYVTLQFSFSGRGNSEGAYKEMTIERQARQVLDMVQWLKEREDVVKGRIGIFAQSFGAATAMLANPPGITSLLCNCGAYYPYKSIKRGAYFNQKKQKHRTDSRSRTRILAITELLLFRRYYVKNFCAVS
ncbi:hypothetical protein M1555_03495 [Patescibacteria group bacterium]|nr:hypothetical protein [Patescibacteria group bacterium]